MFHGDRGFCYTLFVFCLKAVLIFRGVLSGQVTTLGDAGGGALNGAAGLTEKLIHILILKLL